VPVGVRGGFCWWRETNIVMGVAGRATARLATQFVRSRNDRYCELDPLPMVMVYEALGWDL
jgi:hypothetical protein